MAARALRRVQLARQVSPPTLQEGDSGKWRGLGSQYSRSQAQRAVSGRFCLCNLGRTQAAFGADEQGDTGGCFTANVDSARPVM